MRGPKPSITLEVVQRVSERVGRGMPLRLALAAEGVRKVNEGTWKAALKLPKNAHFAPIYEAAKAKFLDEAMRKLAEAEDLKHLQWLLERRHSDLFARPEPAGATVNVSQSQSIGIPAEVLQRAREIATAK